MEPRPEKHEHLGPRVATRQEFVSVLIFSIFHLLFALLFILWGQNHEFLLYIAVMGVIATVLCAVHAHAGLSRLLLWGFSIWGMLHILGGLAPIPSQWHKPDVSSVVYNWRIIPGYLKYDQAVHGFGVGLVTWFCWQVLASRVRGHDGLHLKPTPGMLALCATAGMGFGSINEIVEFFAVLTLPETNVGGYNNTGWDLVANLIGSTIAVIIIRLVWNYDHRHLRGNIRSNLDNHGGVLG